MSAIDFDTDFTVEIETAFGSRVYSQSSSPQLANRDITSSPDQLSHPSGPSNPTTLGSSVEDDQRIVNPSIPRLLDPLGDVLEDNELGMDEILIA